MSFFKTQYDTDCDENPFEKDFKAPDDYECECDEIDYNKFDNEFSSDEKNERFIIVHLCDGIALGPFESFQKAKDYIYNIPNELFENNYQLEHAQTNGDFLFYKLKGV